MEMKTKSYDLKLPSAATYVRPTNIWKTSINIAHFGKTFTDKELAETGTPINEKNLYRILSYMRYLGILTEKREKVIENGKQITLQSWVQDNSKDVQDFFFYLQDKRFDEAKIIFKKIVENHDIFQSVKNDLLKAQRIVTEIDLRDYFRRYIPNKSAYYYKSGVNTVIQLFEFLDLVVKDGNRIKLKVSEESNEEDSHVIDEFKEKNNVVEDKLESDFVIKIKGKDGTDFTHIINSESDLDDIESLISIIRKKIKK